MVVMICNDINPYSELSLWWSLIVTIRNVDIAVNNEPVLPMLLGALATAKTISRPTELIHLRDFGRINKLYYVFESTNHQPTDAQPSRSTWQWKNPTNTGKGAINFTLRWRLHSTNGEDQCPYQSKCFHWLLKLPFSMPSDLVSTRILRFV